MTPERRPEDRAEPGMAPGVQAMGPIERSERRDRRHEILAHAWLSTGIAATHVAASLERVRPEAAIARAPQRLPMPESPFLLVSLAAPAPAAALASARAAAGRGARLYALVDGDDSARALAQQLPSGSRTLVRRRRRLPGSFVLGPRGEHGLLFLGPPGAEPRWLMRLSPAQGQALWQIALHWFWHQADAEAWSGAVPFELQAPAPRPFDVALPGADAPVHLTWAAIETVPAQALWHAPDQVLPRQASRLRTMVVSPSGAAQTALAARVQAGAEVVHADTGLPFFTAGDGQGVLDLVSAAGAATGAATGAERLRVVLTPAQVEVLASMGATCVAHAPWRFRVGPALGELTGPVWLPDAPAPASVIACEDLPCGRATATTLRAMNETPPPARPAPSALAATVLWTWTVDPPRVPASAVTAPLVSAWKALDADVAQRLVRIRASLAALARREDSIAGRFAALGGAVLGAVLGFGRSREARETEVASLGSAPPSALGPVEASKLLHRLSEIEAEVLRLDTEVEQAEARAAEDEERRKHEQAWQQQRAEAEAELPGVRAQAEDTERKLAELAAEEARMSEIPDKKDRKAKSHKLRNERHRLEQERDRLDAREALLCRRIEQPFEFRPGSRAPRLSPPSGGNAFVPQAPPPRPAEVPAQPLPAVGTLWADRNILYLAIERWGDLEAGEAEARRLGARLVAPKENP